MNAQTWRTDEPCPVCGRGLYLTEGPDGAQVAQDCRTCGWSAYWQAAMDLDRGMKDGSRTGYNHREIPAGLMLAAGSGGLGGSFTVLVHLVLVTVVIAAGLSCAALVLWLLTARRRREQHERWLAARPVPRVASRMAVVVTDARQIAALQMEVAGLRQQLAALNARSATGDPGGESP